MSAGKPVIVTKSGGPEYIVPDEFGIKIDKENSEALAKSIDEMIKNYENYNPKKIRAFVEANFSYENIAKKIGNLSRFFHPDGEPKVCASTYFPLSFKSIFTILHP